jgi:hypothetical protein
MDDPGAQLSRSHGGDDKKLQEMLVKLYELYICRISFKERWNCSSKPVETIRNNKR